MKCSAQFVHPLQTVLYMNNISKDAIKCSSSLCQPLIHCSGFKFTQKISGVLLRLSGCFLHKRSDLVVFYVIFCTHVYRLISLVVDRVYHVSRCRDEKKVVGSQREEVRYMRGKRK